MNWKQGCSALTFVYFLITTIIVGRNLHTNPRDSDILCQNQTWACLCTLCVFHSIIIYCVVVFQYDMRIVVGSFILNFFFQIWALVLFHKAECANLPLRTMIVWEMVNFYASALGLIILILYTIHQYQQEKQKERKEYHRLASIRQKSYVYPRPIPTPVTVENPPPIFIVNCSKCNGSGSTRCYKCSAGFIYCSSCGGRGNNRCNSCSNGYTSCFICGGRGSSQYINSGTQKVGWHSCGGCSGSGRKRCYTCDNGNIRCGVCNSSGRLKCYSCHNGTCPCENCKGTGKIRQ
jgi:hypothetical protein